MRLNGLRRWWSALAIFAAAQSFVRDGQDRRPPVRYSFGDGAYAESAQSVPLAGAKLFAINLHNDASASVVSLLDGGAPPAVAGRVVLVVVDAIDAVRRGGAPTHVGQKVGEAATSPPARANSDASASVQVEFPVFSPITPFDHRAPCAVLGTFLALQGFPVGAKTKRHLLSFEASARTRKSLPETRTANFYQRSAGAAAEPVEASAVTIGELQYGPSVESLPLKVDEQWHRSPSGDLRSSDMGQACRRTRFSGATLAPQLLYHDRSTRVAEG